MAFGESKTLGFANPEEVIAEKVIIEGSGSVGIFVYNGFGSLGNPPILSIVPPGVTTDPFGNAVQQTLEVGVNAGPNVRIDGTTGQINLNNASALTTIRIDPGNEMIGWYPLGSGAGHLTLSVSAINGTDASGNTTFQGFASYGLSGQAVVMNSASGVAYIIFPSGAVEEAAPAQFQGVITNPGASEVLRLFLSGPQGSVHTDHVSIYESSAAKDNSVTAGGSLVYTDTAGTVHLYGNWGIKGFRLNSAYPGDLNTYQAERASWVLNGSTLINAAGFTQISPTFNVGVGQYIVEGVLFYSPTIAGGTLSFEWAGGGAFIASSSGISWDEFITGTPYVPGAASFLDPAVGSAFVTGTLTAARRKCRYEGTINVSTAGTLALFANSPGGAGSANINSRVTLGHLYPVGP